MDETLIANLLTQFPAIAVLIIIVWKQHSQIDKLVDAIIKRCKDDDAPMWNDIDADP